MLFNSYIFIFLFLPLMMGLWWSLKNRLPFRMFCLLAGSYIFYGYWNWKFCSVMLVSTVVDYIAGKKIYAAKSKPEKKKWLAFSLAVNLGLLGFFKYFNFFIDSLSTVISSFGIESPGPFLQIVLPVGISFYTFQSMSYSIDIFRGNSKPAENFLHFSSYVSMFPQLIAGPIIRYSHIEDQLKTIKSKIDWNNMYTGIQFFTMGMCKKVIFADTLALHINPIFADSEIQFFTSWVAILGYTLQLYFDFSGYSDMAVGLGFMLGFKFPQNFNSPYKARNISDFWRRWHITLSSWLRDYLFIPLGGSKSGKVLTLRNLVITMFLGGLWHGAGWNFILWGIFHGLLLLIFHIYSTASGIKLKPMFSRALTFFSIVLGWVLFRCETVDSILLFYKSMFLLRGVESNLTQLLLPGLLIGLGLLWCFFIPNVWEVKVKPGFFNVFKLAVILFMCVLLFSTNSPFLYFQF